MQSESLNFTQINVAKEVLARQNLPFFSENTLGYNNSEHHMEWLSVAQETLTDNEPRKIVVQAPRNHSKTTDFSIQAPLWLVGNNPNLRILIVSDTSGQAVAILRAIKNIIENNDEYKDVFGELKPKYPEKWAENEIIVNRNTKEKDATFNAVGVGGAILSKRADIIICDDLLNKDNTKTYEQRKKTEEWFNDVLMPVLDPEHGKLIFVGTVFHSEDLITKKMTDPTYDVKLKYQAIIREADRQDLWAEYRSIMLSDPFDGKKLANAYYAEHQEEMDAGAIVLWPQRWSYKRLFDERVSVGSRSFNLMYQNIVIDDETAIFKESWIDKAARKDLRMWREYKVAEDVWGIKSRGGGVDLAVSKKKEANDTAIATVGWSEVEKKYVLMHAQLGKFSPSQTRGNIQEEYNNFDHQAIIVESNAFQASLSQDMKEETNVPIVSYVTTGQKFDEEMGINSMAVTFENEQWMLPADLDDPATALIFQRLKEGLMAFTPGSHTHDIVMAIWFAWSACRTFKDTSTATIIRTTKSQFESRGSDVTQSPSRTNRRGYKKVYGGR